MAIFPSPLHIHLFVYGNQLACSFFPCSNPVAPALKRECQVMMSSFFSLPFLNLRLAPEASQRRSCSRRCRAGRSPVATERDERTRVRVKSRGVPGVWASEGWVSDVVVEERSKDGSGNFMTIGEAEAVAVAQARVRRGS